MKKRICIDIRVCQKSSRYTGVGIYAFNLSKYIEENNSEFDIFYLLLKNKELPWEIPLDRIISIKRSSKPESLQELFDIFDLKYILKKNRISVYHSLVPGMITPSKTLFVINTLHDIIPDILPLENHKSIFARVLYKLKMKLILKSSFIIADSIATQNDFNNVYGFSDKNISVIYLSSQFSSVQISSNQKVWYRKYILYTGGFNYRKNVPIIIKSFASIANNFPEVDLLIVGKPSKQQYLDLNNIIENLTNLKGRVVFKGFISDSNLPQYYANSEAFIYPSLYEGFGIPVLEAMQCNTPVITSDRGSIPEVVGSSGLLINPDSISEIANAISKILLDSNLQNILRKKGITQSKKFTWESTAEDTIKVYKKVLNII